MPAKKDEYETKTCAVCGGIHTIKKYELRKTFNASIVNCGICNKFVCKDSANDSVDWMGRYKNNCCVRDCVSKLCKIKDVCNKCRIGGRFCSKECYDEVQKTGETKI